jgi:hypothetical protein
MDCFIKTDQEPISKCYVDLSEIVLRAENYFKQEVDAGQPLCDVVEAYGNLGIRTGEANCCWRYEEMYSFSL